MQSRVSIGVVVAVLLLGTACPQAEQNEATSINAGGSSQNDAQATEVRAPATPTAPVGASFVWLATEDKYRVAAWYWPSRQGDEGPAPGVICLPMRGHDKSTYGALAPKLVEEGYAVIAIDFRGHGETLDPENRPVPLDALTEADYQHMLRDVAAAHQYLDDQPQVDGERVGIVGASIGANLAIIYAAADLRVRTVVALSPGLDYKGLRPTEALEGFSTRALYLAAARGDKYSYDSCLALKEAATLADPVSLREFAGKDHGTNLLKAHPGFDDTIASGWLLNHLPPTR